MVSKKVVYMYTDIHIPSQSIFPSNQSQNFPNIPSRHIHQLHEGSHILQNTTYSYISSHYADRMTQRLMSLYTTNSWQLPIMFMQAPSCTQPKLWIFTLPKLIEQIRTFQMINNNIGYYVWANVLNYPHDIAVLYFFKTKTLNGGSRSQNKQ